MADREGDDSDAPEEFTSEQGKHRDEEIIRVQRENKARINRERKEWRRKQAQKLTPRAKPVEQADREMEAQTQQAQDDDGMLPQNIVNLLAANEKTIFSSDIEEDKGEEKQKPKKKRAKKLGVEPIILNKIPSAPCIESSLDFLKKRKMQVPRSSAVLNNPKQALRLLSSTGVLR